MKLSPILFFVPLLSLAGCSLGPHSPQVVGQVQAPISFHDVSVYLPQCVPAPYQTVAKLDASKLGVNSSYQFNLGWIKQLSKQAAGMGANGLMLIPISSTMTAAGQYSAYGPAFKATAIRVSREKAPPPGTLGWAKACTGVAKLLNYDVFHFAR